MSDRERWEWRPQRVRARYAISDQPMSAEEWKKQYVKEG